MLRAGKATGDAALDRFLYQARILARLHHPAIPTLYELGLVDRLPYMATRFVEGRSFDEACVPAGTLPAETARLVAELADALQSVHEQGVVHRHVRPGIVVVDEHGHPHLTDFAEARLVGSTTDGSLVSSPNSLGTAALPLLSFLSAESALPVPSMLSITRMVTTSFTARARRSSERPSIQDHERAGVSAGFGIDRASRR